MTMALPREEVAKAVERRGPSRVPMMIHLWNDPARFESLASQVKALQDEYPNDALFVQPVMPGCWNGAVGCGVDSVIAMSM